MTPSFESYVLRMLRMADEWDFGSCLSWRCSNESVKFFILCNDEFWWGCADAEEVLPEDMDGLEQAMKDARAADEKSGAAWGPTLWCARKRKIRPQGAAYPPKAFVDLWTLFDACGPEREIEMGNPCKPGE